MNTRPTGPDLPARLRNLAGRLRHSIQFQLALALAVVMTLAAAIAGLLSFQSALILYRYFIIAFKSNMNPIYFVKIKKSHCRSNGNFSKYSFQRERSKHALQVFHSAIFYRELVLED